MKCIDIKPGMKFDGPNGKRCTIVREGTYDLVNGKKIWVDNHRKNKWWASGFGPDGKDEEWCCFDPVWDNDTVNHFSYD